MKHGKNKRLIDSHPYSDSSIVVATMHEKEKVIGPVLNSYLRATVVVPNINTDSLGTFCGHIKRKDNALETAIDKALKGINEALLTLGVANEGSFFNDSITLIGIVNHEVMVFIDTQRELKIVEEMVSYDTNFARYEIKSNQFEYESDFKEFLVKSRFDSHALIVYGLENKEVVESAKGITSYEVLVDKVKKLLSLGLNDIIVETDMRAHCNPTRMKNIEQLAKKLIKRVVSLCVECNTPGFGITELVPGLPCHLCNNPTDLIKEEKYGCLKCNYKETKLYSRNPRYYAEPYECSICNP